jgi:hypothetical protein
MVQGKQRTARECNPSLRARAMIGLPSGRPQSRGAFIALEAAIRGGRP